MSEHDNNNQGQADQVAQGDGAQGGREYPPFTLFGLNWQVRSDLGAGEWLAADLHQMAVCFRRNICDHRALRCAVMDIGHIVQILMVISPYR